MGEPLLRGGCTCWVWGFCRGCGGLERASFLTPVPNRCSTFQAQPCFCLSCGSGRYLLHHIILICGKYQCSAGVGGFGDVPTGAFSAWEYPFVLTVWSPQDLCPTKPLHFMVDG